jgi:hypothetical protein
MTDYIRCPFCGDKIYSFGRKRNEYTCYDLSSHNFWVSLDTVDGQNCWYLQDYKSNLYIDDIKMVFDNKVICHFENITPEKGIEYLKKYLKLRAFE